MRVSLPINTAGVSPRRPADSAASTRPAAYPRRSTSSGVIGISPTRPRTPSVPKYFLLIVLEAQSQRFEGTRIGSTFGFRYSMDQQVVGISALAATRLA